MSKVYNYMVISVGLTFLLKFAGIPSGADAFIEWMGLTADASGISLGAFFVAVAAVFTIGVGSGIAISFFTRTPSETFIVAPVALGIFTVITSTFISVINYTKDFGFVYYIIWLIFIPLLMGFGITIIQFWRGAD
jgi:uncharacterized membrane protein YphA (DoxX/SURF4 family)